MAEWEKIKDRYERFWKLENEEGHIVSIEAPIQESPEWKYAPHASLKERWCDVEYMLESTETKIKNTYYACDAFPLAWPDLGPDQFAAFYGTPLEFGETTSWARYNLESSEGSGKFTIDRQNFYYKKLYEMLEAMTEAGKDKYFVGIPDLHPGLDGLVSMRGPQNLCMDTIENPNFLKEGAMSLLDGLKEVYESMYQITARYQQGSSNWMGIWHPGRWYVTCCDFSCLISPEMYEEFALPELREELKFFDASMYHLDGPGALKHLDRLLSVKELQGIQWVYGEGAAPAPEWISVLDRIHAAGKAAQIYVEPRDLEYMLEHTAPEGTMFKVYAQNAEEAARLEKIVERHRRK